MLIYISVTVWWVYLLSICWHKGGQLSHVTLANMSVLCECWLEWTTSTSPSHRCNTDVLVFLPLSGDWLICHQADGHRAQLIFPIGGHVNVLTYCKEIVPDICCISTLSLQSCLWHAHHILPSGSFKMHACALLY